MYIYIYRFIYLCIVYTREVSYHQRIQIGFFIFLFLCVPMSFPSAVSYKRADGQIFGCLMSPSAGDNVHLINAPSTLSLPYMNILLPLPFWEKVHIHTRLVVTITDILMSTVTIEAFSVTLCVPCEIITIPVRKAV